MSSRREFIVTAAAIWQAALVRAQEHRHAGAANGIYEFHFLTDPEKTTLRRLMAIMIPADERSGGAVGAKVDEYIDFVLLHSDADTQAVWRRGLQRYKNADIAFLEAQAAHEFDAKTQDQQFFALLKSALTEGFYTSEAGIDGELGYQGMGFVLEFQGCTHANHGRPDGWRPSLKQSEKA